MIKIKRGLDIPVDGVPVQDIASAASVHRVALLGGDTIGMKPTMEVDVGDQVKTGQLLFTDKKTPGVRFTAPASGTVVEINRGERRAFQSLVIDVEGDEKITFDVPAADQVGETAPAELRELLVEAGLWPSFRTRPYGKTPPIDTEPDALFVTAIDTNPLAADPAVVLKGQERPLALGLSVLRQLISGPVYFCSAPDLPPPSVEGVTVQTFSGPHPAGLVGTHIHHLRPVNADRCVWHIGYQDVVAIGQLILTGHLMTERVVSLGGPLVKNPRLIKTRLGASLTDLTNGELTTSDGRLISGSVLNGTEAAGPKAYLGRYHQQVTALPDGGPRQLFGWTMPGANKFSINRTFLSRYLPSKRYLLNTSLHGSPRAIVPIGSFEKVMPLALEAVYLLRALACGDSDAAQDLGCLELDEEDLALCTFVCNGKNDYGSMLRQVLTLIEKEG